MLRLLRLEHTDLVVDSLHLSLYLLVYRCQRLFQLLVHLLFHLPQSLCLVPCHFMQVGLHLVDLSEPFVQVLFDLRGQTLQVLGRQLLAVCLASLAIEQLFELALQFLLKLF